MRHGWTEVALGEVLRSDIDAVPVDPTQSYPFAGVYGFGRGLFARESVSGGDTTYSHFHRLHADQVVMSQPKGWEGAITVVPQEFDGRFLSSVFPTFSCDSSRLDTRFMRLITMCPWLWDELLAKSNGIGARRNAVYAQHLLEVRVPLPPLTDQQVLAARIDAIENRINRVRQLREEARIKREALTISLHLAMSKDRTVRLNQLLKLAEEQRAVAPEGSYPQVGIRSFGLGLFKKPPVAGTATTYRSFNTLRPGMFVMSQVKGWEGAIGVCGDEFDGWFVSPEYRTFVCLAGECDPDYLAHLVLTPWFHDQLAAATRGVGARRERVRPEMLLGLEMPFPAIEKQTEAVKVLNQLRNSYELSEKSSKAESALLPSLLDQIFNP